MAIMPTVLHLLPILLVQLAFSFRVSSGYTLPDKYFINCGSESDVNYGLNRRFVGDVKPGSLLINPGKGELVKDDTISKSIPEIYHTARVYNRPTWYVFDSINQNGTYVVRLHFFPFSSQVHPDLPKARFNVWASTGFQLLSNFSLQNSLVKTPVVKEFAFELEEGPFGIHFSPLESSPLAFVNAIEVFLAPELFKPQSSFALSPQLRSNGSFKHNMVSEAFRAIYRLSMGGYLITPDNDTLWRTWLPDDGFLAFPAAANNVSYGGNIEYDVKTTIYTAPAYVYSNAKEIKMDSSGRSEVSNLTWVLKVRKNTKYFVRLHWCDIKEKGTTYRFDYFVGSNRTWLDSSEDLKIEFAMPFRYEQAILSDGSGYLNVGIAHNKLSPLSRAFLNGLEIMELIDKSFSGPILTVEEKKQNRKLLIIGVLVAGAVIIALMCGLLLFYFKTRKSKNSRPLAFPQNEPSEKINISDLAPHINLELKISFADITAATNGFDEKKVIGVGGFGKVYHGTLGDKEVAVKRSRSGFGQGRKEFQTEIIILHQSRHRHLVTLYGYCDEQEEMILVYEYMEMGTLKEYLYSSKKSDDRPSLSWKQRLKICVDSAKGLEYLHTGSTAGVIIHRDIKTTNILLDKNYMAKVADFGISKFGVPDGEEFNVTIKGTPGYVDREYLDTGLLTEKSDVYAFGVVLFEVLSGRAPIVESLPIEQINLVDWAILCKSKGEIEKLIDPFLVGTIEPNSLRKFVEVAEMCANEFGAKRPSMREVVYDLELALDFQFTPVDGGKAFDSSTIVDSQLEFPSMMLGRIPSTGLDDSIVIDNDSTTVNARELVAQFKIDCPR